ncbi:hypothetical protein [Kitasatospora sp. McL0602]|uniref:hypothetical protein n=1 Tax=Kitasatospora sp. McL0602 TaxID=3439530 RepID=UPI003F88931E
MSTAVAPTMPVIPTLDADEYDMYRCECGGRIEAAARLWFNVTKGADGQPTLEIYGVAYEDCTVSCDGCGKDAPADLDLAITDAVVATDADLTGMEL